MQTPHNQIIPTNRSEQLLRKCKIQQNRSILLSARLMWGEGCVGLRGWVGCESGSFWWFWHWQVEDVECRGLCTCSSVKLAVPHPLWAPPKSTLTLILCTSWAFSFALFLFSARKLRFLHFFYGTAFRCWLANVCALCVCVCVSFCCDALQLLSPSPTRPIHSLPLSPAIFLYPSLCVNQASFYFEQPAEVWSLLLLS